ncbi:MAG: hypothetical protein KatS3mg050_3934 [Litorilinea sp.]|nr:MAG: hypothetical protein KatS3mg050_3934 [Litorilinea sp.]
MATLLGVPAAPSWTMGRWVVQLVLVCGLWGLGGCTAAVPPATPPLPATPAPATAEALPPPAPAAVEMPAPSASGEVLFQDDFTNVQSGWPNAQVFDNYFIGYHEPAYYHVEVRTAHDRVVVPWPAGTFEDVAVEAAVFVDPANTAAEGNFRYGLALRRTGEQYYGFLVAPRSQHWYVVKSSTSGLTLLADGSHESIQGQEASPDHLRVETQGPLLRFMVNGHPVAEVQDEGYTAGSIGFLVQTEDAIRVHVHHDWVAVYPLAPPVDHAAQQYHDDFTDPLSGWPGTLVFDNYFIGYHEPEYYHVEVRTAHDRALVSWPGGDLVDATVEVALFPDAANTAVEGDFRYGLALRRTGDQYYGFMISPRTQRWFIFKSTPARLNLLAEGRDDSIQGEESAPDQLRVDARGASMLFTLNGQPVGEIMDDAYDSGVLALVVQTLDSPRVHVHYDMIQVGPVDPAVHFAIDDATCTVDVAGLNLRSGPGIDYDPPMTSLTGGTLLEPLARSDQQVMTAQRRIGTVTWIQVRVRETGQIGWVSGAAGYVSCTIPLNLLPEATAPATP